MLESRRRAPQRNRGVRSRPWRLGLRIEIRTASALGLVAFVAAAAPSTVPRARGVPAIVFVSRQPATDGQVPGLGPSGRALATGGRLLVRERDGEIRPLLPEGRFFDVADPCVGWDGKRVLFAATESRDGAWRIWVVDNDGRGLAAVTRDDRQVDLAAARLDAARFARYDDFDPIWLPDDRVLFASTRFPQRAQGGDVAASNLFVTRLGVEAPPLRITAERNGGEEPSFDRRNGRVLYARWWFNRYLPTDAAPASGLPAGVTLDRATAVPADTIDLWAAGSILTDGDGVRLGAGDPRLRPHMRAHQPIALKGGDVIGVWADPGSLVPAPVRLGLYRFAGGVGAATALTGPGTIFAGAACSPAELPDGRILFAGDTGAGDFGIYVMEADGSRLAQVVDMAGTLELDATPLVARPRPAPVHEEFTDQSAPGLPHTEPAQVADQSYTFRFDCLNLFAQGDVDAPIPSAPPAQQGLRMRFYAALARPETQGGDSLVLLREVPVEATGAVHVDDIIADTPVFEQLVDAGGRVLRSARGPTHVAGFNFARMGAGTKCVGCHTGHSVLPVPTNNWRATWFNAAPSAEVWTSSQSAGLPAQLVDRRARGTPGEVGWVAAGLLGERVRLSWQLPIEVRAVVLYALQSEPSAGTQLRVRETELVFLHDGRVVKRLTERRTLSPNGTRVECEPVRVDAIEIVPTRASGSVGRRPAVALAEIETIARLIED
jgi:hypothetical protein